MKQLTDDAINRLCAEQIMGWKQVEHYWATNEDNYDYILLYGDPLPWSAWRPLTDPAHNDLLLDRMVEMGRHIIIVYNCNCYPCDEDPCPRVQWSCEIGWVEGDAEAEDPDRKRAIVMACLSDVGAV